MKSRAIPEISAWVSANAGSGKTYVLAQRTIRLLLAGVPPARILCLTFTKAAAAHMANQVLNTLREWTGLDDAALDERLAALGCDSCQGYYFAYPQSADNLDTMMRQNVVDRARDAGRTEGADHPRVL